MTTKPRNEYCVKLRGTVETATQVYAESAEQAGDYVTTNGWNMVWGDHEGEDGEVCDQLDDVMPMEIMSVEFVRELPPPPKPPQNIYDETIMRRLISLLQPYLQRELDDYAEHGGADHPYHQTYQSVANLVEMWNHKGVDVKLRAPTPEELDQQRMLEQLDRDTQGALSERDVGGHELCRPRATRHYSWLDDGLSEPGPRMAQPALIQPAEHRPLARLMAARATGRLFPQPSIAFQPMVSLTPWLCTKRPSTDTTLGCIMRIPGRGQHEDTH